MLKGMRNAVLLVMVGLALGGCHSIHRLTQSCNKDTDGYKQAMDSMKKGDIAIFTTPLAFRWVHFKYAIEKGLNVFMEKPLSADGPTSRRMLELAEQDVEAGESTLWKITVWPTTAPPTVRPPCGWAWAQRRFRRRRFRSPDEQSYCGQIPH